MYVVLTTLYPDNPSIEDWLGIGPTIRSPAGVVLFSLHACGGVRVGVRPAAVGAHETARGRARGGVARRRRPGRRGRARSSPGPPVPALAVAARLVAGAAAAVERRHGPRCPPRSRPAPRSRPPPSTARRRRRRRHDAHLDPARRRSTTSASSAGSGRASTTLPIRPDRSALLRSRAAGGSTGSTCGCARARRRHDGAPDLPARAEPYKMHFDEVYHARTATEFLQDWRYGHLPRHLRVDPPAPGQVRDGRSGSCCGARTTWPPRASSRCPVVAAAVEPRRIDEARRDSRAGERLYVATGTEIRTYDLRTRAARSRPSPAPGRERAGHGRRRQPARRRLRRRPPRDDRPRTRSPRARRAPASSRPSWRRVDHPDRAPARHRRRRRRGRGLVRAADHGRPRLRRRDRLARPRRGSPTCRRAAAGPRSSPPSTTSTDHAAFASSLADILANDKAADYQARLDAASPGTTVVLGNPPGSGEPRKKLDAAIADGTCPASASRRSSGSRSRPPTASRSSTRSAPRSSPRSSSKAAPTAWRW